MFDPLSHRSSDVTGPRAKTAVARVITEGLSRAVSGLESDLGRVASL